MCHWLPGNRQPETVNRCVPWLPGCWSQGKTGEDALGNIKDAIEGYLETVEELSKEKESRYVEVGSRSQGPPSLPLS
ncbi:MAG: type II toxin-antitoxin system HicB family antitoxin [Nitrospinae bacterium]|nr:type II toxin-antitoxin system HicB family antitoxin [Nitrospinota bacterium]